MSISFAHIMSIDAMIKSAVDRPPSRLAEGGLRRWRFDRKDDSIGVTFVTQDRPKV